MAQSPTATTEKRKVRAYKIADKPYNRAMSRAEKEEPELATQVESWVTAYGEGKNITITDKSTAQKVKESGLDEERTWKYLTKTLSHLDDNNATARKIHDYIFKALK